MPDMLQILLVAGPSIRSNSRSRQITNALLTGSIFLQNGPWKCVLPYFLGEIASAVPKVSAKIVFSRIRSEGFSFNSGGLGVESCSRSVVSMFATVRNRSQPSATVRNRSQPSATVRSRTLRRCHWGKLLQVTFHGCVTCQFATLFHCDLHENDMSRKKRDAFRCTGAVV